MSSNRGLVIGGTAVAGGIGYYLYRAGGNPKVAEREAERDVTKLRGGAAGTKDEAKAEFKLHAEEVGQKLDSALEKAKAETHKLDAKLENYRATAEKKIDEYTKEAGKELHTAVDTFDKKVTETAAKSKGYFSSWFGGK
ncbi:hypothetical protein W97_07814 [Coniosporium apollinis CBS 100218]|uniref:Calcofluor white hypersensitive protein n=1 Tax=Coniosporium apollinis (strain CBS 100218) TaxID=1168221 RepID=R7Z3R5_CONA1|nr:uncharacterized protein W97_07814 [Coniosporium apollinis CBS 100218]EON68556.1 hypothetical protein W97_07814 [Coniosporium apollinis CBS 100218]